MCFMLLLRHKVKNDICADYIRTGAELQSCILGNSYLAKLKEEYFVCVLGIFSYCKTKDRKLLLCSPTKGYFVHKEHCSIQNNLMRYILLIP